MSTCPPNTLLASGKDFQRLSDRELQIVTAQLLCNISGSGGASAGGHVAIVDAVNGSDTTGTVNGPPFLTLAAAKAAAVSGTTIIVRPGTYNENNLLKDGVNWNFMPGAIVDFTQVSLVDAAYAIFDDRSVGAVDCVIAGDGVFKWHDVTGAAGAQNPNAKGTFFISNANSNISFKGRRVECYSYNTGVFVFGVSVTNCVKVQVDLDEILDPKIGTTDAGLVPEAGGIYWEIGELHVNVRRIRSSAYAIWCHEPTPGANTTNAWFTIDRLESNDTAVVYVDCHSTNYRTWIVCKEAASGTAQSWNYLLSGTGGGNTGGRHYITAEKIVGLGYAFNLSGGELWVTIQKIANTAGSPSHGIIYVTAGTLYGTVEHIEDNGGAVAAIEVNGGTVHLAGQFAQVLNGPGILHTGGICNLNGYKIDTANTNGANNHGATVSAAGLKLRNCVFVPPALANSIFSSGAQTVGILGPCSAKLDVGANITLSPNAGYTVDSAVA